MKQTEYINELVKLQCKCNEKGLKSDMLNVGQAFYEQHKLKHGSYKSLIFDNTYESLMSERYDFVIESCNDVYTAKLNAIKQYKKLNRNKLR